ncbi:expressed unknown protein [Ectocarpus siliculosus]|uniref:Uncharacterized protein n=1 Tax=Ectocarpus siliculosus TaxID=2880 RepID=D7FR12_ECTSI|nr:expressed unknown protein [Ectocarpus siliculosus]|eukprot:CBJ26166.1 expressed unknown protein [Ectocarpus siliculosus]
MCKMCKEQRSKARGGSRGGRAGGRGGVAPRSGQGRGHAARNGQGRGHAGRRGAGGEAKQRQIVFKLPRGNGDQSTTVAVRLGNADNWVITSVNPERQTSSCSRTQCQGLRAGLVAQQQTAGSHGGVASAIGGLCKHAKAALEHMRKKTVKDAREVKGDGWDWDAAKEHVATAKSDGHLSVVEHTVIMTMVERAEGSGVWPVYETEPNHFVVRDDRTRTSEHDYACVKYDTVEPGKSSRRLTPPKNFMCRVSLRIDESLEIMMEIVSAGQSRRNGVHQ